ncbi:MAG: hypothetical protein R3B46_14035 [Phycisphaerales bacterium]
MKKQIVLAASGLMLSAGASAMAANPDVVLCQLYNFSQASTDGSVRGMSVATTSWNIGDADLQWFQNPNSQHPFIAMNMYRMKNDRMEMLGTSWVKHGFFALSNLQCDLPNLPNCVFEPGHSGGSYLGQGCTDTYSAGLNDSGLGPRFEINPWTGAFSYSTSIMNTGVGYPSSTKQQIRVEDADMNPTLNAGATYYFQGYYVHFNDTNHMNSAAWKQCTPVRSGSGNYTFTQSGSGTQPTWGFAIDAWSGASQTVIAEQLPVVELVSPDGRCILAYKVTDNGNGTWHYEYALLNVDMDRQVDEFAISSRGREHHQHRLPCPGPHRSHARGSAAQHRQRAVERRRLRRRFATTPTPSAGAPCNFRFGCGSASTNVDATVGLFLPYPGRPDTLPAATQGLSVPTPSCDGDINNLSDRRRRPQPDPLRLRRQCRHRRPPRHRQQRRHRRC